MEEGKEPQSVLDQPVRSVLDLKIGTVLKAYAVYVGLGLVFFLIGVVVLLSVWHHETSTLNGGPRSISWGATAGETVTPREYDSVRRGARLQAVRKRFGEPATVGSNPLDLVSGETQTCLGYRSTLSSSALYLFCFEARRLIDKQTM